MKLRAPRAAFFSLLLLTGTLVHGASHQSKILDLSDTVARAKILTKFSALVQASDLATFLSSRGPFTFFVPTNSAFSKLPPGMFEDLLRPENKPQLQRVILFHVVNGKSWFSRDLLPIKSLLSCDGNPLALRSSRSGTQFVAKARILHADIKCSNGLIHEIDTMLMPPHLVVVAGVADPAPETPSAASTNAPPADTNAPPAETNAPAASGQ